MGTENGKENGAGADVKVGETWSEWWKRVLSPFVSVHFFITIVVMFFWISSIGKPLNALHASYGALAEEAKVAVAENAIDVILKTTTMVSGLFTTVLGLVLGHYFGQRGQESAERALSEVESAHDSLLTDLEGEEELMGQQFSNLKGDLQDRNEILLQALEALKANAPDAEIDPSSALLNLLDE